MAGLQREGGLRLQWTVVSHADTGRGGGVREPTGGLPAGGAISMAGPASGWLVAASSSTTPESLFQAPDAAATWQAVRLSAPPGPPVTVLAPPTPFSATGFGYVFAVSTGSPGGPMAYVTRDAGSSWQGRYLPSRSPRSVSTCVADGHGWEWAPASAPGGRATLFATMDGGTSWQALPADPSLSAATAGAASVSALDFANDADGWALVQTPGDGNARVYRTTDGGGSWSMEGGNVAG